jgi:endonuclease YncB( thermonuclease family)
VLERKAFVSSRWQATHNATHMDGAQLAKRAAFSVLALGWLISVHAADFAGTVVAVADGDTLTVLVDRKQVKVRIADIDAPESKQAFGSRSRQALAELCFRRPAQVTDKGPDRYGRTVGEVSCAGRDVATDQVRAGMAWVFTRYAPKNSPLYAIEAEARTARRGLWADQNPVPPWEWRATEREKHATRAATR